MQSIVGRFRHTRPGCTIARPCLDGSRNRCIARTRASASPKLVLTARGPGDPPFDRSRVSRPSARHNRFRYEDARGSLARRTRRRRDFSRLVRRERERAGKMDNCVIYYYADLRCCDTDPFRNGDVTQSPDLGLCALLERAEFIAPNK